MKFAQLAEYFQKLEATTLRLKITAILAELFQKASSEEIDKICYLSLGRLGPRFATVEFNLAEKMMVKIISHAFAVKEKKVREEYKRIGDLGETASKFKIPASSAGKQKIKGKRRPVAQGYGGVRQNAKLSVNGVYQRLLAIAQESGEGSVERKIEKMASLLQELDPLSVKYVVRIPLGKLRLGFSDLTILDALSWLIVGDKTLRLEIEAAYNVRADVGEIASKLKIKNEKLKIAIKNLKLRREKLIQFLAKIKPHLGTPIMPALCQRLPTAEEMIKKMGKVAVEPKYDGTRLQIHFERKHFKRKPFKSLGANLFHLPGVKIKIFTRNLENVTSMFPDLVMALKNEVRAKNAILDGEAIGYDRKTGQFLPFQETIKRKRKYQVSLLVQQIPLKYFVFDLLYYNDQSFLQRPFHQRRSVLEKILPSANKTILLSPQIVTDDPLAVKTYHDKQIAKGLEGAVLKKWSAFYEPGRRGFTWVKFKSEKGKKGGGLADTLDCVVMGYYRGRGKRAGFGIGAFLVGVRRSETSDQFLTISKIGTGLTDAQWREMKRRCSQIEVGKRPKEYVVEKELVPDIWCVPGLVVEIEADNITKSPVHTAGYALRFPRLVRFREDKSADQATSLKEVKKLYRLQ